MIENKRRRLVKVLGGSAAMVPVAWTRPVVQSVVLPAHARATSCGLVAQIPASLGEVALGIFDSTFTPIFGLQQCCDAPISINAANLGPGTYYVSAATEGSREITVNVTTCTSTCSVTQIIEGGDENGCGNAMVRVELPSGDCTEVDIAFPC